ncbi:hypothetical protein SUGI_0579570 [Cryptomeria japonica]|nr:hypothetical protein SUGI_0579570 [Cryptomeria japonica]
MATKPDNGGEKKVFYDPVYSPRRSQNNNNNNRQLFDDFSVANHVHFLRPPLASADTSSLLQKQNKERKAKEDKP